MTETAIIACLILANIVARIITPLMMERVEVSNIVGQLKLYITLKIICNAMQMQQQWYLLIFLQLLILYEVNCDDLL